MFLRFVLQVGVNHHGLVVSWIATFCRHENCQETGSTIYYKRLLYKDLWTNGAWRNGK